MKNYVVGIDVSKDKMDICVRQSADHKFISKDVITNDQDSIADWLTTLGRNEVELAVQYTDHYGALLASILTEQQFVCFMLNALDLKHCLGVARGESDTVDACRTAASSYLCDDLAHLRISHLGLFWQGNALIIVALHSHSCI